MIMTKGKAFVMCYCAVLFIFCAMFVVGFISHEYTHIPVAACLTAIVTITGGYIGMQVANNGVKGHNWNQQMFDSENKEEKETGGTKL
jgi:hypothetical protein